MTIHLHLIRNLDYKNNIINPTPTMFPSGYNDILLIITPI